MIKKIKEILLEGVEKEDFPGGQFCLIENDVIKCDFVGYKSLYPTKQPTSNEVIYDVASLTKVVSTNTLIFKLIEDGKIELETKVKNILPNFKHESTIEEMLLHTSGLRPLIKNHGSVKTKKSLIDEIYSEELIYPPYTKIVYSDTGFMLLGFIIEKVSGKSLDKFAEEVFIKPLKMDKTTYSPNSNVTATTEFDKSLQTYVNGFVHDERSRLLNGLSGHAGLFSTAEDLAKFINSFLNDEKIIKNKNKELIFSTIFSKPNLNDIQLIRTYGFEKYNINEELIGHTGFTGCNMWIDKKNKRGFVLLTNAVHPKRELNKIFAYRRKIFELYYKKEKKNV